MNNKKFEIGASLIAIKSGSNCVVTGNSNGEITVTYSNGKYAKWSRSHINKYYKLATNSQPLN